MSLFALVILSALAGVALGTVTGLIPGLHVNTVSVILLSMAPGLAGILQESVGDGAYLVIASSVVAMALTHTFLDFIPGCFLGAPEEDVALSVLPAHKLLLAGKGYRAVALSALGSFGAVVTATVLVVPFRLLVGPPLSLYQMLKDYVVYGVIAVALMLILTETARLPYPRLRRAVEGSCDCPAGTPARAPWAHSLARLKERVVMAEGPLSACFGRVAALGLFLLAGLVGWVVLPLPVRSPISPNLPASVMLPLLSGTFGLATLIDSLRQNPALPQQRVPASGPFHRDLLRGLGLKEPLISITTGTFFGSIVGFLPGMTGAIATVMAMLGRKVHDEEQTIVTLSAVNTANAFFVMVALFLILRPRSGAAIVVNELVEVREWTGLLPPSELVHLLAASVVAAGLAGILTVYTGRWMAGIFNRFPYRTGITGIIIFVVAMTWTFTGWLGLVVLITSTFLGFVAPSLGLRRSLAMGCLMVPVIIYLW